MTLKRPIALLLAAATVFAAVAASPKSRAESASITKVNLAAATTGSMFVKDGLLYTELDDGTYEVGYDHSGEKPSGVVVIPAEVNGKIVTRIAESGFYRCKDLADIVIPDSVIGAGENAFTGTKLLGDQTDTVKYAGKLAVECAVEATSVTIKEGTLGLGDRLFALAPDIANVTLPESLLNIGSNTFMRCTALKSVNIPSKITTIGPGVFYGCSSLAAEIPAEITEIGAYAFAESGVTHANIPNIKKIGKGAFENSALKSSGVTTNSGYVDIGGRAFAGTAFYKSMGYEKYLGKVFVGCENVFTGVTLREGTTAIADMAFAGCGLLKTVTIPGSVKTIGSDAFFNCGSLNTVTIANGVESIGEDAFRLCGSLNAITLPISLTYSGEGAFYGCTALKSAQYPGSVSDWGKIMVGGENALPASPVFGAEPKVPGAVSGVTVKETAPTSVTLTWNKSALANKYRIDFCVNGVWKTAGTTNQNTLTYTVKGLPQDTECQFAVYAAAHEVMSAAVKTSAKTTLAPVTITGTVPTDNTVTLSWKANSAAERYQVDIYKNGAWYRYTQTASNTVTSVNVSGLSPLTEYRFNIYALKGSDHSTPAKITVSTLERAMPVVTGIKAVPSSYGAAISWNADPLADSYQVDMLKNGVWTYIARTTGSSYTVSGLSENTEYQFRVFAFKGADFSSPAKISTTTPIAVPSAVTGLSAAPGANNISLSWNADPVADSYQVDMLKNGVWTYMTRCTGTSYNVTGLSPKTSYRFRVFAFKGAKYSAPSIIDATTAEPDKPSAVTGLTAAPSATGVSLSWNKSPTADSYQVDMYKNGKWVYVAKITGTSYSVTGLSANTSYNFRVFAFKGSKYSTPASISAATLASGKPSAVTGLKASPSTNSVALSWNKSSDADSYQIDMYKNGKWVYMAKITGTSYSVTGLSANTSYNFRVFAFKGSSYSPLASVSTTTLPASGKPAAVTGLKASPSATGVALSWNKNSTADSYQVDMYKNGKWTYMAKITGTSYSVTGLSANTTYNFRVFAFKGSSYSTLSSVSATTLSASGKPAAVTGLSAAPATNSVSLSWNKNPNADTYQVDMYKNGKWTYVTRITGTSYNVAGLSANTTYNFRVFAFKGSSYSAAASVSAATRSTARAVLAPPVSSAASLMSSRTMLKGIDVSGWQGDIDFKAVKESGVDFVIVKAGESDFTVESWERNYARAKEAGLMVGAYWYSHAVTVEEGKTEAKTFLKAISGKKFEFPVYMDIEESKQFALGMDFCTRVVDAFCTELENAGYCAGVYCSTYWYTNYVNDQMRVKRPTWIAEYNRACNYGGSYGIWQYTSLGRVSGIEGDVDLNWGYVDYSKYIKANKCSGY